MLQDEHPLADVCDTAIHYSVEWCQELGLIGPEGSESKKYYHYTHTSYERYLAICVPILD